MPLATIHLFSLSEPSTLPALLKHIVSSSSTVKPLVLSKPIRWIIRPEHIDAKPLLDPRWDLLMILEDTKPSQNLVSSLLSQTQPTFTIQHHYTISTGIPSRLTKSFSTQTNPTLLHPKPNEIPALTGALDKPLLQTSSQSLSLSHDLLAWIGPSTKNLPVHGAVSMLNFLAFKPDQKASYLQYGKAFGETIGAKRGGNAKLVGNIVSNYETQRDIWDEFALAHYPSLLHFADMLASKDYQEVNQKFRVPSLRDTCILCTSELEIEDILKKLDLESGRGAPVAKL